MAYINFTGNIAHIDKVQTESGTIIAKLYIVEDDSYTNKETGELIEKTNGFNVDLFKKDGEENWRVDNLSVGDTINVQGKLVTEKWVDKYDDGSEQKRSNLAIKFPKITIGFCKALGHTRGNNNSEVESAKPVAKKKAPARKKKVAAK